MKHPGDIRRIFVNGLFDLLLCISEFRFSESSVACTCTAVGPRIKKGGVTQPLRMNAGGGGPSGDRTRVSGVRGQRPRPLDDGTEKA
jgi:hypothetical protein